MNENQENKKTAGWKKIAQIIGIAVLGIVSIMAYRQRITDARKSLKEAETEAILTHNNNVWKKFEILQKNGELRKIPDKILKQDVEGLLKCGVKIDDAPLNLFIEYDKFETIQLLLDNGVDVNKRDKKDGRAMLHIAALNNDLSATKFLLKQPGIDVNITDNGVPATAEAGVGRTPLFLNLVTLYSHPHKNRFVKWLLIKKGASVDIPGAQPGWNPKDFFKELPEEFSRHLEKGKDGAIELKENSETIIKTLREENKKKTNFHKKGAKKTTSTTSTLSGTIKSRKRTEVSRSNGNYPPSEYHIPRRLSLKHTKTKQSNTRPGKKRA